MSSYILGDSWPERPSWTRYMKESTYRHDFGKTQQARDDVRIPITQNANYNQGPYTDRDRGYSRYDRFDGSQTDRPGFRRNESLANRPITERPGYERYDGPQERRQDPYDNRGDMYGGRGPQTDRGDYGRGRMEERYERPREMNRSPERNRYNEPPANYDMYDKYGNNRTTQKDYGDFNQQKVRAPVDRPHAYRGKVDAEMEAFHNKHGDQWVNKENEKAESDRNEFQNIAPEEELPESLRLHGYYRFKAIPYRRQMLLNDNYELISPRGGVTQRQKNNEKQDDKLYGTYSKHLTNSDAVRHRNMEYAYDQQQRLPQHIAPQRDYKHNLQRPDPTESGAYLFIRANKNNFHDIKTSFQKHKSVLHLSGVLKGIALNDKISVVDDFTNWNITHPIKKKGTVFYDQGPKTGKEYSTDYIMVCLWFPSVDQAKKWIDYDKDFQNSQFPDHNGVDMLIVPINYLPSNDVDHNTFVMTEYQDVIDKEGLNRYVREPIDDILRKESNFRGCDPFVVWTEDVQQRRLIVSPKSFVSIHRFNSLNQAMDFVCDARVERIKREIRGITRSGRQTTVIFQLVDFV